MSRPKSDPVLKAFETVTALNVGERERFEAMLVGFNAASTMGTVVASPKPARVRKTKAAVNEVPTNG